LRKHGVVGKFVEYCGSGLKHLSLPDRATLANMAPEYGATIGFFPVDEETVRYLKQTNRGDMVEAVEAVMKAQQLFRMENDAMPEYSAMIDLDLSTIDSTLAGPKRPQDRVPLRTMKSDFKACLSQATGPKGFGLAPAALDKKVPVDGMNESLTHGSVVIAAITSCTNTSNPYVMIGAGLLAQKAVSKGLRVKPFVKTSLAPGSQVVTDYLAKAGVLKDLEKLGLDARPALETVALWPYPS
jgi:aconitate hydratase